MKKDAEYANLWYTQSVSVYGTGKMSFLSKADDRRLTEYAKETKNEFPDY